MKNLLSPDNTKIVIRILDLFCGAGGAAEGYRQALEVLGIKYEIVGVDIAKQPRYPFTFVQGDALEYLALHGSEFDFIHASPPCQQYSACKNIPQNRTNTYPDLVVPVREALIRTGVPYVIENVVSAPLHTNIILCGTMFGLKVYRHRAFESSLMLFQPAHFKHTERIGGYRPGGKLPRKAPRDWEGYICVAGGNFTIAQARRAMGIDWMTKKEIAEAIPPAYTRWIGMQIFSTVERVK